MFPIAYPKKRRIAWRSHYHWHAGTSSATSAESGPPTPSPVTPWESLEKVLQIWPFLVPKWTKSLRIAVRHRKTMGFPNKKNTRQMTHSKSVCIRLYNHTHWAWQSIGKLRNTVMHPISRPWVIPSFAQSGFADSAMAGRWGLEVETLKKLHLTAGHQRSPQHEGKWLKLWHPVQLWHVFQEGPGTQKPLPGSRLSSISFSKAEPYLNLSSFGDDQNPWTGEILFSPTKSDRDKNS